MNLIEKLFGFSLKSSDKRDKAKNELKTFIPSVTRDGAITIDQQPFGYGGYFYSTPYQANRLANEFELITKYRQMALHPIIAKAIEEICNESIVSDENGKYSLEINLDKVKLPNAVKQKIIQEFDAVLRICKYSTRAYSMFRQNYIDGKMYNAIIIDDEHPERGIQDVRLFDPRQIQLVRHIIRDNNIDLSDYGNSAALIRLINEVEEYFIFNPYGIYTTYVNSSENISGLKLDTDTVSYIVSGLMDAENQIVISYLEQASKVLNQLSDLEDSMVIYRMSRSTEKRVFYVGVGRMNHAKSSQYIKGIAERYKTKIIYDPISGKVDIGNNQKSLVEDYFLPTREGDGNTRIETLQGGQALDNMPDLDYFWKLLSKSLNVPPSRIQESSAYSIGKSSEITRDEISFKKFISRLQLNFSEFPLHLLKVQLELKGVLPGEEFDRIKDDILINFATDNFFYEMKEAEILSMRASTANDISSANEVHQVFSSNWIKKNIFKQTDEEIETNNREINEERIKRAQIGIDNPEEESSEGGTEPQFGSEIPQDSQQIEGEVQKDNTEIEDEDIQNSLDSISDYIENNKPVEDSNEEEKLDEDVSNSLGLIAKYINQNINK